MIQSFKAEHQSLMVALIDEIEDLESRTRRRLRESGMLLAQCVDFVSPLQNISHSSSIPETTWNQNKIEKHSEPKRITGAVTQLRIPGRARSGQTSMEVEQHCLASC